MAVEQGASLTETSEKVGQSVTIAPGITTNLGDAVKHGQLDHPCSCDEQVSTLDRREILNEKCDPGVVCQSESSHKTEQEHSGISDRPPDKVVETRSTDINPGIATNVQCHGSPVEKVQLIIQTHTQDETSNWTDSLQSVITNNKNPETSELCSKNVVDAGCMAPTNSDGVLGIQNSSDIDLCQSPAENELKRALVGGDDHVLPDKITKSGEDAGAVENSASCGNESPAYDPRWDNDWSRVPQLVTGAYAPYSARHNFVKGCKWSPDGTCVVTNAEDNCLRLYNLPPPLCQLQFSDLPDMEVALKVCEGGLIYDYCWLPGMTSADPSTCGLVSTSRESPIHLWNAYSGELTASYRAYDHMDELTAAYSVAVSHDGTRLYSGYNKMVRVFDMERPGSQCQARPTHVKAGQGGIISCFDVCPTDPKLYAAGSYSRTVALYHEPDGRMSCLFQGQAGGVTQLKFSPDGTKLYSGGRKDSELLCWDMRNPGHVLYTLQRDVTTNLRMYFDIDTTGRYVISGGDSGLVSVWDTQAPAVEQPEAEPLIQPHLIYKAHADCVNGVSLHPSMPLIATACGQRHFRLRGSYDVTDSSEEEGEEEEKGGEEAALKLWWIGKQG